MERIKVKLHKVASNSHEVVSAFDDEENDKHLKHIELRLEYVTLQMS